MPASQDTIYPSITEVCYKNLRFLITDSPDNENLPSFIEVYMQIIFTFFIRYFS